MSKEYDEFAEEFGRLTNSAVLNRDNLMFIGETLRRSVQKNFNEQGRYGVIEVSDDGDERSWQGGDNKWVKLTDSTTEARKKKNKWPGKILQVSGSLKSSINYTVSGETVTIAGGKKYGEYLQYGTVNMAPRPFLMLQNEDVTEIEDYFADYLAEKLG